MAMAAITAKTKKKKRTVKAKAETKLRQRGSEALGFLLVLVSAAFAVLLITYSPSDPSFSVATDAAPTNLLGVVGSYIADPLHKALGWAAFGIPLALFVWGVRLVLHRGQERAVWRAIAVPPMIAAVAAFLATQVPPSTWAYEYGPNGIYGLGGVFGDTAVSAMFVLLPSGAVGPNLLLV